MFFSTYDLKYIAAGDIYPFVRQTIWMTSIKQIQYKTWSERLNKRKFDGAMKMIDHIVNCLLCYVKVEQDVIDRTFPYSQKITYNV